MTSPAVGDVVGGFLSLEMSAPRGTSATASVTDDGHCAPAARGIPDYGNDVVEAHEPEFTRAL